MANLRTNFGEPKLKLSINSDRKPFYVEGHCDLDLSPSDTKIKKHDWSCPTSVLSLVNTYSSETTFYIKSHFGLGL